MIMDFLIHVVICPLKPLCTLVIPVCTAPYSHHRSISSTLYDLLTKVLHDWYVRDMFMRGSCWRIVVSYID